MTDAPPDDRSPQPASELERDELVTVAIGAYRELAFHLVDPAVVAERSGLGVEAVRRHFPDRDDLVFAVTRAWYARRMAPVLLVAEQEGAVALLRAVVRANIADPALMRYLAALVNIAATPGHPLAPLLQQQWLHFYALVQRAFADDVLCGREPSTAEPAAATEQLIALYEGLQLQSMVRPAMNLLGAYDRAVVSLRDSWSLPAEAPVWSI